MKRIFIDGSAGTTGLRILERLSSRKDIALTVLSDELRKDATARREALNAADLAFLCLPDDAAREAVSMVENPRTIVIDTSTAHRVLDGWQYGFAEISSNREKIASSRRIANPGCHASGFIALVEPLVAGGILSREAKLCAYSLTGYSGGGKKMIASYEEELGRGSVEFLGGRQYALLQAHKHLPEMVKVCNLAFAPVFSPVIVPHYSGMETVVMVHGSELRGGIEAVRECYRNLYSNGGVVRFKEADELPAVLSSAALTARDDMFVSCHGNEDRVVLTALFDNLGKGASGAAIQNMNLALGFDETAGLELSST